MHYQILLVEPHQHLLDILTTYLTLQGYRVQGAQTAEEARAYVANTPVDVGIINAHLPRMDDLTLCAEVRKCQAMPLILLTGLFTPLRVREQAIRVGVDRMLPTPFELTQLEYELTRVLPAHASPVPAACGAAGVRTHAVVAS